MPPPSPRKRRGPNWSERGSAAVDLGDLDTARQCFAEAVRADRGNATLRYHLAVVQEALSEPGAAAASLAEALRLDHKLADAARRLSLLAGRCELPADEPLNPVGLKAALAHDTVDRDLIAEAAIRQLAASGPLGAALAAGRSEGWTAAACGLCRERTAPLLRDELFLEVLHTAIFRSPEIERLLTALRRVLLLDVPVQRLEERALFEFALALARQCQINEHVWSVDTEEARRVDQLGLDADRLLAGDPAEGRKLLLGALYRPISGVLGEGLEPQRASAIRPRALRDVVVRHLADAADERERRARLPRLRVIAEPTAREVAQQYEANPYPRWTSVGLLSPSRLRRGLGQYFTAQELAFLDRPFEVLIAGCGTGQQAVQAALAFGPHARVLAIDLSAASLAYAARMAERFGAHNIEFAQADLQTLHEADPQFAGRFHVIECTGVLHHLAEAMRGWRALLACLAGNGLMFVGLYSAIARRSLTALRGDPAYPGPGCTDAALRAFRQVLLDRPAGALGGDLKTNSRDFYTTSNFRDLALHVSEHSLTLPEIAQFLGENGLSFRGFQLWRGVFGRLRETFPAEIWPGSLDRWAEFEEANPHTFQGMYNFWCTRADPKGSMEHS
jgi:2-polyprenyl-3-methyl-5-hydroxy-6-metoxy-1,4-benzoquinol methylase